MPPILSAVPGEENFSRKAPKNEKLKKTPISRHRQKLLKKVKIGNDGVGIVCYN